MKTKGMLDELRDACSAGDARKAGGAYVRVLDAAIHEPNGMACHVATAEMLRKQAMEDSDIEFASMFLDGMAAESRPMP